MAACAVLLPVVVVDPAVLAEEAQIVREEGWLHVAGRYFANASDAATQRRWEAERRVREGMTRHNVCSWCMDEIEGRRVEPHPGKPMHPWCASEADVWMYDGPTIEEQGREIFNFAPEAF